MPKKILKFSVYQLIINSSQFDLSTFSELQDKDLDIHKIIHENENKEEILSIKKFTKSTVEERFITIYFNEGNKFPYTDKVIDSDLKEHANPRSAEEIELDNQFFVLIDSATQRIFISDQRKKSSFNLWLHEKMKKEIIIKPIIDEEGFLKKIKSIKRIFFTVVPNIFNSQNEDILSNKLVQDIYGFDAERASIELSYDNKNITDKIIRKVKLLIGQKEEFKNITIIGRNDEDFESIFNVNEIINTILIDVYFNDEEKLLNETDVFNTLIGKIKEYEKNN